METNTILEKKDFGMQLNERKHSFFYTNELVQIENTLKELLTKKSWKKSRKLICIGLYQIKNMCLYKQIGLNTFKEYLKTNRIPISYSTAIEYSIIGNMLVKYEKELNAIGFDEKDGLKKLLRLKKALNKLNSQPDLIFKIIKQFSLREFERYLDNNCLSIKENQIKSLKMKSLSSIQMDDEVIYITPDEIEIIWFNMDLETKLGIPHLYKELQSVLLSTIKNFFQTRFRIN